MTIEQLVKELDSPVYKTEEKKIERLKKYLRTDYVEYNTKMSVSKQILEQSRYTEVNGKKIYCPNGALEYQIKVIALVQLYFKDIVLRDGVDRTVDFNLLEKNNITALLIKAIGDDFSRFEIIYSMTAKDLSYKESFVSWIDSKWDTLSVVFGRMLPLFESLESEEKEINLTSYKSINANS